MENAINWFELPVNDLSRAAAFYSGVMGWEIEQIDMHGTKMGFLPSDGKNVSGALVQGDDYRPSTEGTTVYLNGGNDLQIPLSKVEKHNGKVIVPKTQISPEMGYFAMFIDTEGNRVALHSMH